LWQAVVPAVAEFRAAGPLEAASDPMTELTVAAYRKPVGRRIRLTQVEKWAEGQRKKGWLVVRTAGESVRSKLFAVRWNQRTARQRNECHDENPGEKPKETLVSGAFTTPRFRCMDAITFQREAPHIISVQKK
jgi:hypothetical protein